MKHPTLSTLLVCGSLVTALSALLATDDVDMAGFLGESTALTLPPQIITAEAHYEVLQQIIDKDYGLWLASHMADPPRVRRERLIEWMTTNRAALEEQLARSNAVDALYERHQVPPPLSPSEVLERNAPATEEEAASPLGRSWKLGYDLARLREVHAGNPRALRDALREWNLAHAEEIMAVEQALRNELAQTSRTGLPVAESDQPDAARSLPEERLADISEESRTLFLLEDRMREAMAGFRRPAPVNGIAPSLEECRAWRDAVAAKTSALAAERDALSLARSRQTELKRATENKYESQY